MNGLNKFIWKPTPGFPGSILSFYGLYGLRKRRFGNESSPKNLPNNLPNKKGFEIWRENSSIILCGSMFPDTREGDAEMLKTDGVYPTTHPTSYPYLKEYIKNNI
ncbi:MAG: hypothetical protein ACRCX4_10455 [Bacteroidales bacterium]